MAGKGVLCSPGVKSLILIFPGGLCGLLASFGHRAEKKSKGAVGDMKREAGMKPYSRIGDRSCTDSMLVPVSRGAIGNIYAPSKLEGCGTRQNCYWLLESLVQWGEMWCSAPRGVDGPQMLHAAFLPWFLICRWGEKWGEKEGREKRGTSLCPAPRCYLQVSVVWVTWVTVAEGNNRFLRPDGSSLIRRTEH